MSDIGKAAFGVYPQLKGRRANIDLQAEGRLPLDFARGMLSGVLGMPGDLESLVRLLPGLDEETWLPTSEDIEKRLPFRSESPLAQAAAAMGIFGGGAVNMGPGVKLAARGLRAGAGYGAGILNDLYMSGRLPVSPMFALPPMPDKLQRLVAQGAPALQQYPKDEAIETLHRTQKELSRQYRPVLAKALTDMQGEDPRILNDIRYAYKNLAKPVSSDAAAKAYDLGYTMPASRVSLSRDVTRRSPAAWTPGLHLASPGNESQLAPLLDQYLDQLASGVDVQPAMRPVLASGRRPIQLIDEAFEDPNVLGQLTGLYDQMRHIDPPPAGYQDVGMLSDNAKRSAAITNLLDRYGVDLGVYLNEREGILGPGNISYTSFRRPRGMAGGGLVKFGAKALRKALQPVDDAMLRQEGPLSAFLRPAAPDFVVKPQGGQWLDQPIEREMRRVTEGYTQTNPVKRWADTTLKKYVKRDMGTPNDPVRLQAEQGILHLPEQAYDAALEQPAVRHVSNAIRKYGNPHYAPAGESLAARAWDRLADDSVDWETADGLRQNADHYKLRLETSPWLDKLAPTDDVYNLHSTRGLGFEHILDVLDGDIQRGHLRPDALQRISVPQAVRRTWEYDQMMAKRVAEAQARVDTLMPVVKDYPEGYKWLELKQPEIAPQGDPSYGNKAFGWQKAHDEARQALRDALKYEGDTMGHCVGGYCDRVAGGQTRIFSLRGPDGRPHVTIEAQPRQGGFYDHDRFEDLYSSVYDELTPLEVKQLFNDFDLPFDDQGAEDLYDALKQAVGYGSKYVEPDESENLGRKLLQEMSPTAYKRYMGWVAEQPETMDLIQVKGKQNAAPNEEYLPFVQDFIKSREWRNLEELDNAGLRDLENADLEPEFVKMLGLKHPRFATDVELNEALDKMGIEKYEDVYNRVMEARRNWASEQ